MGKFGASIFLCSLQDAIFSIKAGTKNINLALVRAKVTFCDSYVIVVNSEICDWFVVFICI